MSNRSYHDITNNRELKEHHNHINYDNEGYPVSIRLQDERAYGGINVKEKNERPREAEIPYSMSEELREVIENRLEENGGDRDKPFFENVPDRLGCHRFRQEYAKSMYKQYLEEHGEDEQCRGYDRDAMLYASINLGHNREDVIKYNYLSAI